MSDAFLRVLRNLLEMADLKENWDSEGARPVDPACIVRAARALVELHERCGPLPSVVPTREGGVQLEWEDERGYAEVEFLPDGRAGYLLERKPDIDDGGWWVVEGELDDPRAAVHKASTFIRTGATDG